MELWKKELRQELRMKTNTRTKFISEVTAAETEVTARSPFKVERDNRRRFIRLELSALRFVPLLIFYLHSLD